MDKNIVYVIVYGGVVQDIINVPKGIKIHVLDHDIDGCDESNLSTNPFTKERCSLAIFDGGKNENTH